MFKKNLIIFISSSMFTHLKFSIIYDRFMFEYEEKKVNCQKLDLLFNYLFCLKFFLVFC